MTAQTRNKTRFWQDLFRRDGRGTPEETPAVADAPQQDAPELDIAPNDPILAYLASVSGRGGRGLSRGGGYTPAFWFS